MSDVTWLMGDLVPAAWLGDDGAVWLDWKWERAIGDALATGTRRRDDRDHRGRAA